jgi:hypothetical protein
MTKSKLTLTELETQTLAVFQKGMDCPNEGWLHEMDHRCPVKGKALSGVISSLVKKGVISSLGDEWHEMGDLSWIVVDKKFEK